MDKRDGVLSCTPAKKREIDYQKGAIIFFPRSVTYLQVALRRQRQEYMGFESFR